MFNQHCSQSSWRSESNSSDLSRFDTCLRSTRGDSGCSRAPVVKPWCSLNLKTNCWKKYWKPATAWAQQKDDGRLGFAVVEDAKRR